MSEGVSSSGNGERVGWPVSWKGSSSSVTKRNRDEAHLSPRENFSSQLKHNPFSLRRASFAGERRLKGIEDVGVFGDWERRGGRVGVGLGREGAGAGDGRGC